MSTYRIVFLGDIVGRPGREAVSRRLPDLMNEYDPLFVIVNGENSASGVGITPDIAEELYKAGVDAVTLGNHAFNKREIMGYLDQGKPIVRPGNMPAGVPGQGLCYIEREGVRMAVVNLCGRVFLDGYGDPFEWIDAALEPVDTPHVFVDFHAEATSEKIAFAYHLDGRVTAVVGTHTHVTTADERVLPGGTAAITDVGMCGPHPSVLGMDKDVILHRFRTQLPTRFEVADQPGVICGVVIDVNRVTGRATAIRRIKKP
ncbi:MAG: TIGR00282 family metallophosphoesterase [Armatimonadetes bacterium]|nr:TIGR00282 family metallophosphoesterase [Armatimonadota bacterium]